MRLSTALVLLVAAIVSVSAAPADSNAARMARGLAPKAPTMKRTKADSARRVSLAFFSVGSLLIWRSFFRRRTIRRVACMRGNWPFQMFFIGSERYSDYCIFNVRDSQFLRLACALMF